MSTATPVAKKPIWKQWWFWLAVVVLVIGAIGSLTDDGTPSTETAQPAAEQPAAESPQPAAETSKESAPSNAESEARTYAGDVKATLDVTTSEDLLVQMPDNIQPDMSRDGESRTFAWTFGDGSQMVAVFRPVAGEGSGEGLVLYMVDIKD